nr:hypothetical protein [Treponema sp.]
MPFCSFVVNAVGDANCIYVRNTINSLMVDCGISKKADFIKNLKIQNQLACLDELLITHYHKDHFNIL